MAEQRIQGSPRVARNYIVCVVALHSTAESASSPFRTIAVFPSPPAATAAWTTTAGDGHRELAISFHCSGPSLLLLDRPDAEVVAGLDRRAADHRRLGPRRTACLLAAGGPRRWLHCPNYLHESVEGNPNPIPSSSPDQLRPDSTAGSEPYAGRGCIALIANFLGCFT
jgi:hypothetical protein